MSKTDFQNFENNLFNQLKTEDKNCLSTIESNTKLIDECLNNEDFVKTFVNDFNNTVLEAKVKKYSLFESVLNHQLFGKVLASFRQSDIMIRACKDVNRKAVEWLLTMKIDYNYQDENGMNVLMYAAEKASLGFALEKIMKGPIDINMVDNNGNNALFHATASPDNLKILLKKSKINKSQLNSDGESLLLYCCRYDKIRSFELISKDKSFDPNICNAVGKTAAMYLVENARFKEVKSIIKNNKIDPNYVNKFGQSLVSTFVKKYYQQYIGNIGETDFTSKLNYVNTKNYALTMLSLIDLRCNFNIPIDEDGNTPIMVFLMMKDYVTAKYLLDKCDINLSIQNKYNINASYLSLFIDEGIFDSLNYNKTRNADTISFKALRKALQNNKTFDSGHVNLDENISVRPLVRYDSPYPINPNYAVIVNQWMMEIYYPNAVSEITLGGNTYDKTTNPRSYGSYAYRNNSGGLGTY